MAYTQTHNDIYTKDEEMKLDEDEIGCQFFFLLSIIKKAIESWQQCLKADGVRTMAL